MPQSSKPLTPPTAASTREMTQLAENRHVIPYASPSGRHFDGRLSGAKEVAMRKSRFTESQIVEILKQGEAGVPIAEILRQHNISKATYFQWRAKYAGASVAELKRLKELEAENAKLKRMYAELALENAAIKDVLSRKP